MKTVLLIDDDHETRVTLREALEENGIYVFSAANGRDGLALLKQLNRPLVVLLDQNMPIMNGDDFLKERLANPELMTAPVIVMSAVKDRSTIIGATEFMKKPLDMLKLLEMVNFHLRQPITSAATSTVS